MKWHSVVQLVVPRLVAAVVGAALALAADVGLLDAQVGRAVHQTLSESNWFSPVLRR